MQCPAGEYCPVATTTPVQCAAGSYRGTTEGTQQPDCTTCLMANSCEAGCRILVFKDLIQHILCVVEKSLLWQALKNFVVQQRLEYGWYFDCRHIINLSRFLHMISQI